MSLTELAWLMIDETAAGGSLTDEVADELLELLNEAIDNAGQ